MLNLPLLALALLFQGQSVFPTQHLAPKPEPGKVLAKVSGFEIKASDVEAYLWDWRAHEALEDLILTKVITDEAARKGVKVDDKDVQDELDKRLAQYKAQLPPGQSADDALKMQGMTKSRLFINVRNDLLADKLAERDFVPAEFIKVSTIAVKPASEQANDLAVAIGQMNKVYEGLKGGQAWDLAMKSVTTDQRVLDSKGFLGWRQFTAFPLSVQAEMKQLKAGGYTAPAQTPFGIQIFRIDAKGEGLAGDELNELRGQYLMTAKQNLVNRLRTEAKIERFLGK